MYITLSTFQGKSSPRARCLEQGNGASIGGFSSTPEMVKRQISFGKKNRIFFPLLLFNEEKETQTLGLWEAGWMQGRSGGCPWTSPSSLEGAGCCCSQSGHSVEVFNS